MSCGGNRKETGGAIGIVVSGGPAPGINGVISSTVKEASQFNIPVKGLKNGFKDLCLGHDNSILSLTPQLVAGISHSGGSILGTARYNPLSKPESKERFIRGLRDHEINKLIVIGGEGSAFVSYSLSVEFPELQIVHVPKTIDNDLVLPNHYPSFGFETARYVGTNILNTLMTDARTCERWFLVTSMGRSAGFLALGLGIASGATLTLIPEEFAGGSHTPTDVAGIIFSSIRKSAEMGQKYGVALVAEGILEVLKDEGDELQQCPRDELGRLRFSHFETGDVLAPRVRKMCQDAGMNITMNTKNIGYELRCHQPVSFDIEYTRFLGYGAVNFLREGKRSVMVTRDFDNVGYVPLEDMIQPNGLIRSRVVDLHSDLYKVCRSFMIR